MSGYRGEQVFDITESKTDIKNQLNASAKSNSRHNYGLQRDIDWHHVVCDNREEAEKFITTYEKKERYAVTAVQFICDEPNVTPKYMELLKERNLIETDIKNVKFEPTSEFITCKNCKAKIPVKYFYGNRCPFCHTDLRPKSILNELAKLNKKLEKVNEKISKASTKVKKWLVRYEYPD